jgi:hypothetical protein
MASASVMNAVEYTLWSSLSCRGGDACVARALFLAGIPAPQGDASVPSPLNPTPAPTEWVIAVIHKIRFSSEIFIDFYRILEYDCFRKKARLPCVEGVTVPSFWTALAFLSQVGL